MRNIPDRGLVELAKKAIPLSLDGRRIRMAHGIVQAVLGSRDGAASEVLDERGVHLIPRPYRIN